MIFSKTAKEIRTGLWSVAPHMVGPYLQTAHKILNGETGGAESEKQNFAAHFALDENGTRQKGSMAEIPPGSIGVVQIIGPMIKYGNRYCYGADELVAMAEAFDNHPNIIGQVWQTDTGGGSTAAPGLFMDFLANKKKPVVTHADMCASCGYWISSATDYVMAQNDISSMFGCIGVMATLYNYEEWYKQSGIKEHVIYSNLSQNKNKEAHKALKGDYKLFKKLLLDPQAKKFQDYVLANRGSLLNRSEETLLTGGVFYAERAMELGMIDSIGTLADATQKVRELAAVQDFMNSNP